VSGEIKRHFRDKRWQIRVRRSTQELRLRIGAATADLTQTEREIQSHLREVSRDHTTLVIAHRLSTVVDADEIIVLEAGEIVERGRHETLLASNGRYAAMWQNQYNDEQPS
jgi:ATP-binding cassette subfamily B protein